MEGKMGTRSRWTATHSEVVNDRTSYMSPYQKTVGQLELIDKDGYLVADMTTLSLTPVLRDGANSSKHINVFHGKSTFYPQPQEEYDRYRHERPVAQFSINFDVDVPLR